MGLVVMLSADMFICAVGKSITLRKETGLVYTDRYKEIDEESSSYTDTTEKVLFFTRTHNKFNRTEAGLQDLRGELSCYFQSNSTAVQGDLIVDGSDIWRIQSLKTDTYQGMAAMVATLEREP